MKKQKDNMSNKITENTSLAEILKNPKAETILSKYKIPCLHCPMARFEMQNLKIGKVAKAYGIDVKNLLKDLNGVKVKLKK
jgi:hypothetical protein